MNTLKSRNGTPTARRVRCAIYTRKSTEEGLEQDFNSLDAQRESAEAYIKSQAHDGWECLANRYDDGGFTGGNMDRPALQQLLADIEAGNVNCVVVYKVDRLSRSLLDFARMMEVFDAHQVAFVSVTQKIDTSTSMGRLVLNVLLSFAQFEREIISERTRDKIAAARRKGKWVGGMPLLGYDVVGSKLVVNEEEAARVRTIFALYIEHQALLPVVQELETRGWANKRWQTRKGHERGGQSLNKTSLYRLLTNPAYVGKVRYKTEHHTGEHQAIIDTETWQRVQALLQRNGRTGGSEVRNQFGALLKGLLRCVPCGCAMTPAHVTKHQTKRYRYYCCTGAQKRGWHTCPSKSIPAGQIEQFVVEQIRCIGRDRALLNEVLTQARVQSQARVRELETEQRSLERELGRWHGEMHDLVPKMVPGGDSGVLARLADLQERIRHAEQRATAVRNELVGLEHESFDEAAIAQGLADFDPVWETLAPREQARLVQLLVERVDYDGNQGKVAITFYTTGIASLADELASLTQEPNR